ncbi:DNA ligase LigA-related protein (plasmid) [Bacillus subtilis]
MVNNKIEWANQRQRQILVHSFLYYQLNENIISATGGLKSWPSGCVKILKQLR